MLGKIVKRDGYRQDCLTGYDFLHVHWYASPAKMINGLMKNIFALFNFRITYALAAVTGVSMLTIFPFWGIFLLPGLPKILSLLSVLSRLVSFVYGVRLTGATLLTVPFSLITPYINIYIILKGMLKTLLNDGIEWRGTHYPLSRLRQNRSIL